MTDFHLVAATTLLGVLHFSACATSDSTWGNDGSSTTIDGSSVRDVVSPTDTAIRDAGSRVDARVDVATGTDTGSRSDAAVGDGLPCNVATLLTTYCTSCHFPGSTSAPTPLETYADLTAPSMTDPSQTYAQMAVMRMGSTTNPMPPGSAPTVPAADQSAFAAWVSSGSPRGSCATTTPDPFSLPAQCTTNLYWIFGNSLGALMNPGQACIHCHTTGGRGPTNLTIAGTVYATGHEPDNCDGASSNMISVEITDAAGHVFHYAPGLSGNFSGTDAIATPYNARVLYMGRERRMTASQTSGDCNSCHTQMGTMMAPGRIVAP